MSWIYTRPNFEAEVNGEGWLGIKLKASNQIAFDPSKLEKFVLRSSNIKEYFE